MPKPASIPAGGAFTFQEHGSIIAPFRVEAAMQLHMRGVELVVELMEAAECADRLTPDEMKRLLREASDILALLLARDVPRASDGTKERS